MLDWWTNRSAFGGDWSRVSSRPTTAMLNEVSQSELELHLNRRSVDSEWFMGH